MNLRYSFDRTWKVIWRGDVDPATARFRITPKLVWRLVFSLLIFVALAGVALYFEQQAMFWFALAWGGLFTLIQALIYGYFDDPFSAPDTDVTRLYGKGTLLFLAAFWTVLIVVVAIALYIKA
jgi:hypothetical protein